MSEQHWMERAQTAEAQLITVRESFGQAVERVKAFKANFGVREKSDGQIEIDWDKFVGNLGIEAALELRKVIDELYHISGVAGEKPRVRLQA